MSDLGFKIKYIWNSITAREVSSPKRRRVRLSQGHMPLDFAVGPRFFKLGAQNCMYTNQKSCFWPPFLSKDLFGPLACKLSVRPCVTVQQRSWQCVRDTVTLVPWKYLVTVFIQIWKKIYMLHMFPHISTKTTPISIEWQRMSWWDGIRSQITKL